MKMKRWRVMRDPSNLAIAPWKGAVGIEQIEVEDDGARFVPTVVCWFTRGWPDSEAIAKHVVDLHNASLPREADVHRS